MAHYGIYGVWRQGGRVVAIRKARGPYRGMLDLPGGAPENEESPTESLRRELLEECGVNQVDILSWHTFDFFVEKSSTGQLVNLYHRGLIAVVRVLDEVVNIENVEDVRGVELIDPDEHDVAELTPPLRYALTLLDAAPPLIHHSERKPTV